MLLAGQIGLHPGLMCLKQSLPDQFDQIISNYNAVLKEITQNKEDNLDVIGRTCVKVILYISRDTVIDGDVDLRSKLAVLEYYPIPVVILRVDTLPKNAPLEVEMVALPNKRQLAQLDSDQGKIVLKRGAEIAYIFARYNSLEDFLLGENALFDEQEARDGRESVTRVDVYHPVNLNIAEEVL